MKSIRYSVYTVVALIGVLPFFIAAQSADQLRSEIDQHKAQIDALNEEIAQYEAELIEISGKKQTLQSAVNSLDLSVKRTQAKVKAKQNEIATTELEITGLSGEISNKEDLITLEESAIAETVRALYQSEQASLVELILGTGSVSELWDDSEAVRTIQDNMRLHVQSLEDTKQVLTENRDEAQEKRSLLEKQKSDLASEEHSLAVQKNEQTKLLAATRNEESSYQKLLSDKRAAKDAFESALNDLESRLEYTLDPTRLPPAGKGILRWPLDNIFITQQFGKTSDSGRLYSSGSHNGVDFRATIGTPVKSALTGVVTGTGNTDAIRGCYSYGKWVLVKHGNGLSTLYAHLSEINVAQGEEVNTGQLIGYSGFTGYATGPHLHMTVYATDAVQIRKLNSGKGCNDAVIPVSAASGYLNPLDYL